MKATRCVKVIPQRKDWDCGIAALAMLTGKPYGDVSHIVRETVRDPKLKQRGLLLRQVEDVAAALGMPLQRVYRSKGYLAQATGILGVNGGMCDPHGHWVVLKDGMVFDPSGAEAWAVADYLRAGKCRPATLLVRI